MGFSDLVQSISAKVVPEKRGTLPLQPSTTGGIGNGGHVPFEDDMIVSKPAIIFYTCQVFFNFLAMCCFASVASFQQKWGVGPSGLTGFAIFVSVAGIVFSFFLLFVPVIYEKYDKGARLARALREMRVSFILSGAGTTVSLLVAFITTISAWTQAGCKNAANDPHAKEKGKDFQKGLDGWCSTKKAGAVFFWLAFVFWVANLVLTILEWRNGKSSRHQDPPFTHPEEATEIGDGDSMYEPIGKTTYGEGNTAQSPFSDNSRYSGIPSVGPSHSEYQYSSSEPPTLPRPSIDAYGAFSDPAPTGFNATSGPFAPSLSPHEEQPGVSRTMQYAGYADPYDKVKERISAGSPNPPAYPDYSGYR